MCHGSLHAAERRPSVSLATINGSLIMHVLKVLGIAQAAYGGRPNRTVILVRFLITLALRVDLRGYGDRLSGPS